MELTYTDGSKQLLGTDTLTWKAAISGKIKHAAIYDGEIFDARQLDGYQCVDIFQTPEINSEFAGEILPTNGAEVHYRHDLALKPVYKEIEGASKNCYGKVIIDPLHPGFKHIIMKPQPDKRLGWVDATYNSAAGQIKSSWRYEGDNTWHWTFTIPVGATATVTLPGHTESRHYTAGTHHLTLPK